MKALFVTAIILALAGSAFAHNSHSLFGGNITSDQLYSGGSVVEQSLPVEITSMEIVPEEFESDGADDVEMAATFASSPVLNPQPAMVPEPSTFATLALGGLVLGLVLLGRKTFWKSV